MVITPELRITLYTQISPASMADTNTKAAALATLQKCSAVPNFVHMFNILHAEYLGLPRLDVDEYEYSLLPSDVKDLDDVHDPAVLPSIVIKLLKGCGQAYVREDTCFDILRSVALRKWHLYANPELACPFVSAAETVVVIEAVPEHFVVVHQSGDPAAAPGDADTVMDDAACDDDSMETGGLGGESLASVKTEQPAAVDVDQMCESLPVIEHPEITIGDTSTEPPPPPPVVLPFHALEPSLKAEVMLVLLNSWMMGHLVKTNFIDNMEPDLLRITPCGHDQRGNQFYYFFGTRLYKESNAKHDPLTGTGTFDWDLIASEPEAFQTVLNGLKKLGITTRSKAMINHLENVIIPGLPAYFEEKNQVDLQRRLDHRRRRSAALQQAKEKAKLERQEAALLRSSAKKVKLEDESEWSQEKRLSTAASRAERYQRRAQLLGTEECGGKERSGHRHHHRDHDEATSSSAGGGGCGDGGNGSAGTFRRQQHKCEGMSVQQSGSTKAPETRADLMEKARRLLYEWLTRQTVQWPVLANNG